MGLSHSNSASNILNNSENSVIQNKQHDLTGHFTNALDKKKTELVPSKSKSTLDLYKQPASLVKRTFVKVPSISSPDFKHLENSLFFQLLFDRYLHLFGMAKSNRFHQTMSFNKFEKSDKIINSCSQTVQDAKKALRFLQFHRAQKKILGGSKSVTNTSMSNIEDISKNVSGDDKKVLRDKANVSIKNRSVPSCKIIKNIAQSSNAISKGVTFDETIKGKCINQNFQSLIDKLLGEELEKEECSLKNLEGQYVGNKNNKRKETFEGKCKKQKLQRFNENPLVEEKKPTKEKEKHFLKTLEGHKKQSTDNKDRLGNDATEVKTKSIRKVRVAKALNEDTSGDTSTESYALKQATNKSGFKLDKSKNSRDIPNEIVKTIPKRKMQKKADKEMQIPNSVTEKSENNVKRRSKKKKSYTGVSASSGLTDLTQAALKVLPDKHISADVMEESINATKEENSKLLVTETPVTPTKSHLKSPRVLTKMFFETKTNGTEERSLSTTQSMETVLKTMESPWKPLEMDFKTNAEYLEIPVFKDNMKNTAEKSELSVKIERTRMEQIKLKTSVEAALETPAVSSEISTQKNVTPTEERPKTPIEAIWKIFAEGLVKPTNTCVEGLQTTAEIPKDCMAANFENMESPKPSTETKLPVIVNTLSQLKKPSTSRETAKACIQYNRKAQQALSILNNEVSSALRESFCSIDDIKFRIRSTVEEINEADKLYQRLKAQHTEGSQSTPYLSEPDPNTGETSSNDLLHALTFGLVQTQSENQLRLALLSNTNDNVSVTTTCVHEIDESPLEIPPLACPVVNTKAKPPLADTDLMEFTQPILPKIVPIVEAVDRPCTKLKQQKMDIFNIPPCIPLQNGDCPVAGETTRKLRLATSKDKIIHKIRRQPDVYGLKRPSSPLSKICSMKLTNRDLSPEIKLRLKEIAVRLGLDDLPRSRAHPDLYNKLIKEFMATDSLIEFQRQMKHANQAKGAHEVKAKTEAEEVNETKTLNNSKGAKKNKLVQIVAEELYVPDRKINKIAPTNLNNSGVKNKKAARLKPKFCQFLYREKKKKRNYLHEINTKKELDNNSSNTIQLSTKVSSKTKQPNEEKQRKYANSLWFSSQHKKEINQALEKPLKQAITNSDTVIKCDSTKSMTRVDTTAQTQTDSNSSNKAYNWPQLNLQSMNCKSGLDCFDILDEISLRDLKPLESEYPRKDHIGSAPFYTQTENTYLYKLVYGSTTEQFLQLLSIQEPELHCTAANCQKCDVMQNATDKRKTSKDINLENSKKADWYKGTTENTKKSKKDIEKSFTSLHNQTIAGSSRSTVLPCRRSDTTCLTIKNSKQQRLGNDKDQKKRSASFNTKQGVFINKHQQEMVHTDSINNKKSQTKSKAKKTKKGTQDVASKLLPYIFDPKMRYPTTITVMPVTVTTYTNPHFIQRNKSTAKGQGGDFSSTTQNNLENKTEGKAEAKHAKPTRIPKPSTTSDRKLWDTKYAKSPGINLISYLEKQNSDLPKQMFGDICNDNFFPDRKNVFIPTPTKLGKRNVPTHPPAIPTPRTAHSQPHYSVKGSSAKNLDAASSKTTGSRSPIQKQAGEAKSADKTTLENDIQNVIEMIEGKIIDLVSSPEKLQSEAFNNVEKEIVDILQAMQTEQVKPLDSITEASEVKKESGSRPKKRMKKSKLHSKTSTNLEKALQSNKVVGSKTDPQIIDSLKVVGLLTNETIPREAVPSTDLEPKSSNEESFQITSSCAPTQTPRVKLDQEVNVTQVDIEPSEKIDVEGQTIGSVATLNCTANTLQKEHIEPKNVQLNSSNHKLHISQNESKMSTYELCFGVEDIHESKSRVEKLQNTQNMPIIITKISQQGNLDREEIPSSSNIIEIVPENELQKSKTLELGNLKPLLPEKISLLKIQDKLQIPELDMADNVLTEGDNQIHIIKPITYVDTSESERNSVIEAKAEQETSLVPLQTTAVQEVTSEEFLTPFMHALKQYRQEEHSPSSYNILEFLDTLTNISEDTSTFSSKTITGCRLRSIHYKHKVQVAYILHEPEIFYPIAVWQPIAMFPETNKKVKILFRSEIIANELQRARSLFSSLNLSRLLGFGSVSPVKHQLHSANRDLLCHHLDEVFPCILEHSTFKKSSSKVLRKSVENNSKSKSMQPFVPNETYDEEHGMFLNTVYGMLFSAVFLSLSFNYTCQ